MSETMEINAEDLRMLQLTAPQRMVKVLEKNRRPLSCREIVEGADLTIPTFQKYKALLLKYDLIRQAGKRCGLDVGRDAMVYVRGEGALPAQPTFEPVLPVVAEPAKPLTDRETEVLHWLSFGKSNIEIGMILEISEMTVKQHVFHILRDLPATTRAGAVGIGLRRGLIK